jgi:hypothetical protein
MRTFLTIILALTVLAACDSESIEPLASTATTTSTTQARVAARPTTTSTTTTIPAPAPTTTQPPQSAQDEHSSCSEDGLDPATLQRSIDEGHQPWRSDPEMVAGAGAACFFGGPAGSVEPAGANRYLATSAATGDQAIVQLTQPLGPGTVWLISDVTAA